MEDTLNQTNTTDDNILITLNNVSSFIGLYITTIISFIGIPMNFIVLIILSRKDFEHKFYDTIRVKKRIFGHFKVFIVLTLDIYFHGHF